MSPVCVPIQSIHEDHNAVLSEEAESNQIAIKGMQIFVKTVEGQSFALDVQLSDTIDHVKNKIRVKKGIPIDFQRLLFAGKQLQGEHTLAELKIQMESTIYLIEIEGNPAPPTEECASGNETAASGMTRQQQQKKVA